MLSKSGIPKHEIETLARHFLPQIQAFFESEEGRKEYAAWQHKQALLKAQKANKQGIKMGRERKLSALFVK